LMLGKNILKDRCYSCIQIETGIYLIFIQVGQACRFVSDG
jgi:hypothetical protein